MSLRFSACLVLALAVCGTSSAQLTLSYLAGTDSAASGTGQSFRAADAGAFPSGKAVLTGMTFQTGEFLANLGAVTYLDIYSDSALTTFVGASTNSQSWDVGGTLLTKTFAFDDLELDADTTYYAAFSDDNVAGGLAIRSIEYNGSNPYSGGMLIYSGSLQTNLDANFTATFSAPSSPVPEPSTSAGIVGLVALGVVVLRRRGSPARKI